MPRDKEITIETFSAPLVLERLEKKQSGESGRFRAVASVFGSVIDTYPSRTKIKKGAFARTIRDRSNRIKILSQHDQGTPPIGLPLSLKETDRGLEIYASLNETATARDWWAVITHARELGKIGSLELSIGFDCIAATDETEDGETFRAISELRLWEVSLVGIGADRQTGMLEAASLRSLLQRERGEVRDQDLDLELAMLEEWEVRNLSNPEGGCFR